MNIEKKFYKSTLFLSILLYFLISPYTTNAGCCYNGTACANMDDTQECTSLGYNFYAGYVCSFSDNACVVLGCCDNAATCIDTNQEADCVAIAPYSFYVDRICDSGSTSCQIPQHRGCQAGSCALVPGIGNDTCLIDNDCQHTECQSGSCALVNGSGNNECSSDNDCQHTECQSGSCILIDGPGNDECSTDDNCKHKECDISGSCIDVNTPGEDLCDVDNDCNLVSITSQYTSAIFYYNLNDISGTLTPCSCRGNCGYLPDETTTPECSGEDCPEHSCNFNSGTVCKREGQYYVGLRTKPGAAISAYDCLGITTCGTPENGIDRHMLYNVLAHYVNYDENEAYCTFTSCGNGTWDPDAPSSYDKCPPGAPSCGNPGTCCGDEPDDDPDMGPSACANCPVGYNQKNRHWSDGVAPPIRCCGDDMTDDCMLFDSDYLCFDNGGYLISAEAPGEAIDCEQDCAILYTPGSPSYVNCVRDCLALLEIEDPVLLHKSPYNTSGAYWSWKDGYNNAYRGLIYDVTCANYPILGSGDGWISCNDFIINRDVPGRPTTEKYFTIFDGDGGQNNPQTVNDVSGNHYYYCYTEDNDNYIIAECCGGNRIYDPICLSDPISGGAQKQTGDYITAVKNPGFELGSATNASFWTNGINHEWNGDSISFNSVNPTNTFTFSDPIPVIPGKDYTITAYIYNDLNSGTAGIEVCTPDLSWCICRTDSTFGLKNLQQLSCSFQPSAGVTSIEVKLITNNGATGQAYFDNVHLNTLYCIDDYSFTTDLDGKSKESCEGYDTPTDHTYTGAYCCSEDDDTNEYYNDPGDIGACWNKIFQDNEDYYVYENNKEYSEVFVYNGTFYGCAIDNNAHPPGDPNKPYEGSINFVKNPDFENNLDHYTPNGATASILNIGYPHNKILGITYNSPGDYVSQKGIILQNGETYTITFEAKTDYDVTLPSYDILKIEDSQGIINCGPFVMEEDNWKLFKCSGTWTSDQFAELILETTGDPSNTIFYDNLRIYSSNDFLLNLQDHPNPGGGGDVKGDLITDKTYCTTFDIDYDGTEDYYCSYLEKWKKIENEVFEPQLGGHKLSYIPWPVDPNTQIAECCAEDSCWNGIECIPDQSTDPSSLAYPNGGDGYRCINGEWKYSYLKNDWNPEHNPEIYSGYCPTNSQCLVNLNGLYENNGKPETYQHSGNQEYPTGNAPQCINDSQYILDHYCNNGNWTSRTNLLASDLLGLADDIALTKYTLFCEDYERTLNIYEYSPHPLIGVVEKLLDGPDCKIYPPTNPEGQKVSCVNKICILKYYQGDEERAIFGTTINVPINATTDTPAPYYNEYVLAMFGKFPPLYPQPTYCKNAIDPDGNYHACDGNDIWYNHKIESLIYEKQGISTLSMSSNPFIKFFRTLFKFIQFWKPEYPRQPGLGIDLSFIEKTKDFNKIYIDITPTTSIGAVRESIYDEIEQDKIDYIAINYTGFSADICDTVNKFNEVWTAYDYAYHKAIVCNETGNSYYVTTKDVDFFEMRSMDIWKQLTSELRVK